MAPGGGGSPSRWPSEEEVSAATPRIASMIGAGDTDDEREGASISLAPGRNSSGFRGRGFI